LSVQKKQNENVGNEWQLGSAALKTKLEEFKIKKIRKMP
jgi:hypothetical protein